MRHRLQLWVVGAAMLVLAALACNAPGLRGGANQTPEADTTLTFVIDPTVLTPPPAGTAEQGTRQPTPEAEAIPSPTGCGYWSEFVDDVTVPDGTEFAPGEGFDKTWRFRNNGCLDWPDGTQMIYWGGDQMGGPNAVDVPPTRFNETVDISVPMTAPQEPDTYTGYWQIRAPDGAGVGPYVYVQIEVVEPGGEDQADDEDTSNPGTGALASTWTNPNAGDGDIARLQARIEGDQIVIGRWDQCGSELCDRGTETTPVSDAEDNILSATWRIEGEGEQARTEAMQAALLLDGRLQVTGTVNYDDANLQDTTYTHYFVRGG